MKKLLILAAIFAISVSVCACSGDKGSDDTSGSDSKTSAVSTTAGPGDQTQKPATTTEKPSSGGDAATKPSTGGTGPSTAGGDFTDDESGWGELVPLD